MRMYHVCPRVGMKPPPRARAAGCRCLSPQIGGYTRMELAHAHVRLRVRDGMKRTRDTTIGSARATKTIMSLRPLLASPRSRTNCRLVLRAAHVYLTCPISLISKDSKPLYCFCQSRCRMKLVTLSGAPDLMTGRDELVGEVSGSLSVS